MRFPSADGFIEVPVRWFFADDLPVLPHSTPYGSLNWRGPDERPPDGPGEVVGAARPWRNGRNVSPECCKGGKAKPGGAAAGGQAPHWLEFWELLGGGGLGGGEGTWATGTTSSGGGMSNGSSTWGVGSPGRGGGCGDGSGPFGTGYTGLGGGVGDGSGPFGTGYAGSGGGCGNGEGTLAETGEVIRLGFRIEDDVETLDGVGDEIRLGWRIEDFIETAEFDPGIVNDEIRLGWRIER